MSALAVSPESVRSAKAGPRAARRSAPARRTWARTRALASKPRRVSPAWAIARNPAQTSARISPLHGDAPATKALTAPAAPQAKPMNRTACRTPSAAAPISKRAPAFPQSFKRVAVRVRSVAASDVGSAGGGAGVVMAPAYTV